MGDVLTGMIGGFLAQGYPPETAARLGVYLHGAAGDRLARTRGPQGYLASDLMATLPQAVAGLADETAADLPQTDTLLPCP
jgi:NAD(P)H-hydrate epimerase